MWASVVYNMVLLITEATKKSDKEKYPVSGWLTSQKNCEGLSLVILHILSVWGKYKIAVSTILISLVYNIYSTIICKYIFETNHFHGALLKTAGNNYRLVTHM